MTVRNTKAGFSTQSGYGLTAFTDQELEAVHAATLQILWNTGIKVETPEALDIFEQAGADVRRKEKYGIVKIPNYMVEESIASTPKTGMFFGRRPEDDYFTDQNRVAFTAGFGEHVKIIDLDTREVRPTTKKDLGHITRIQDALDITPVVERAACSGDCTPAAQPVHNYAAMVKNTSKHCFLGFGGKRNTEVILEIAKAAVGGEEHFRHRPTVTGFVCPTSPLTLVNECCESIIACARGGIGISIIPMSLSGASSPVTLAGVMVQHNAEVLSAVILAQLTRKGAPCVYCGCDTIMDLRLAGSPVGVPENALLSVAWAKLGQFYGLPSWIGGCASDSKRPDAQQGYDFSLTAMPAALAGANFLFGLGAIDSLITFDYAAMMMGAEQAQRIMQVVGGIEINDDTMALDLIHETGPGGEYLTHKHTFQHMRSMSQGDLFNRLNRDAWEKKLQHTTIEEQAYQKAAEIIESHQPMPLAEGADEKIQAILRAYEDELAG
ncbi:MAG: trimethylamine methyltransferase family protein [Desulfobacter sp.]